MNNKHNKDWEKEFDLEFNECENLREKLGDKLLCTLESHHGSIKQFIAKELAKKDKEFIEILNRLEVKINEDWSAKASAENMEVFKELNNKIKQIKKKYAK